MLEIKHVEEVCGFLEGIEGKELFEVVGADGHREQWFNRGSRKLSLHEYEDYVFNEPKAPVGLTGDPCVLVTLEAAAGLALLEESAQGRTVYAWIYKQICDRRKNKT